MIIAWWLTAVRSSHVSSRLGKESLDWNIPTCLFHLETPQSPQWKGTNRPMDANGIVLLACPARQRVKGPASAPPFPRPHHRGLHHESWNAAHTSRASCRAVAQIPPKHGASLQNTSPECPTICNNFREPPPSPS